MNSQRPRHVMATAKRLEKLQKARDENEKWQNQIQYYQNFDRHNTHFQTWISPTSFVNSMNQYKAMKCEEEKVKNLERRRNNLRQMLFEEDQYYDLERQNTSKYNSPRGHHSKMNETPTELLKDIHLGIKHVEEDRRRHEAELQLYNQWRNENPVVRKYENSQKESSLKLAWLDQQIQKRMEKEKNEEEIKKMIEDRDKLILEEEAKEEEEKLEKESRERQYREDVELQIKHFKLKEQEAEYLKREEEDYLKKKYDILDILEKKNAEAKRRENCEVALYNINQCKLKLRKKAIEIENQLKMDQKLIEDIIKSKTADDIENEEKRMKTKESICSFLKYVQDQRCVEENRQRYISFIFDSEAKDMWEKQDRQWQAEEAARNQLLGDVLQGLQQQVEHKLASNLENQQRVLQEREELVQRIEARDQEMRAALEELSRRQVQRKMDLEQQICERRVAEYEKEKQEERRRMEEKSKMRKEEERLKEELRRIQNRTHPQVRFNRRIIW